MKMKKKSVTYLGMPAVGAIALLLALFFALPGGATAAPEAPLAVDMLITGVMDGPLTGGTPKVAEFYVLNDIPDLSIYGFGSANNGGGSDGEEFTFPAVAASAGDFIYVASESTQFNIWFGFNPDYVSAAVNINGDDAIELFQNGSVVDVFGDINTDGSGEPWEYMDGWAYRNDGTGPDGSTFVLGNWHFSGPDALDGESSNDTAAVPFPVGSYQFSAAASGLSVSKTGDAMVLPGDDLVYTLTVASEGVTATNVTVTDTLPLSVTFQSASIPTYTNPLPGEYVFSLGQIVSGTQETFNITVTVDTGITTTTNLTNTALVTSAEGYTDTAEFVSTAVVLVSIYDIQYVPDPTVDDTSPYDGQTVYVDGIVVAAPGELGSRYMVIEDSAGGAWSGLYVYDTGNFAGLSVARGDLVRVLGTVDENYGMTHLDYTSAEIISTGNPIPAPAVVATGDFSNAGTAEQWESVYIEFQSATVTDENLGYGEWAFDDGSGATRADDMGSFTYSPSLGDYYTFIRGIGWYSYNNYKLEPRDDADISLGTPVNDLGVTKSGPAYAMPGNVLAYTIRVQNPLLIPAANVVLTDTLPVSVTNIISASNALTVTNLGSQIIWEFGDIPAGVTETVYLTATAPMTAPNGYMLTNNVVVTTTAADDPANNSAAANTTLYNVVPIHDVQYVSDPVADDASPYLGQDILVEGVVVAAPGEIDTPFRGMVIADPAGGAWSGLLVYQHSGLPETIQEGDYVRVLGEVQEHYTLTELDPSNGFVEVISSGNALPSPAILTTGQFPEQDPAASEQWEGVLVEFAMATVTDDNLGYGEWAFDDDSGAARADDLGEKDGNLTYVPTNGDVYNYIRGIGWFSFGNYKLIPRSDADISLHADTPDISKSAPSNVPSGATFTYTISVGNRLGSELTGIVITDTVPANLSGITPLDGGIYANGTITWTVASLADQDSVDVRFTATAPLTVGIQIVNEYYAMTAAEWVTPTFGAPIYTVVGDYTPIYAIQGDGMLSPFEGQTATTEGVVVGFFEGNSSSAGNFNGFFIQDPNGDGNPDTSDAIFVNYGTTSFSGVNVGDMVVITGTVQEFSEWDADACSGTECLTQVAVDISDISVVGTDSITETALVPVGDPISSTLYFESLEGMLVTLPETATVVGPTSYGTIQVVPGSLGVDRVIRGGPYDGMPVGVRPDERYGNGASNLIVGSVVSSVDGPLTYSYGDYMIADQDGYTVVDDAQPPDSAPAWAAPTSIQFTAATLNTYNFDAGDDPIKTTKLVSQVLQMNAPTFLSLQEVDAAAVLPGVVADLLAAGYPYAFAYSHPDVGGHGVAVMWRTDLVTNVITSTAYQGCSAYGSSSSTYDPMWATCRAIDEYPLFSRRPVVITATMDLGSGPQQVVVISNHFKSKLGGASADQRRVEQAQLVHDIAADFETQIPFVLTLGDLNDFEDSATLQALYAGDVFTNTWYALPAEMRYSYIYQGVSQILDHILVSPALMDALEAVAPMHFNADYPYLPYSQDGSNLWRNSDHDPLIATFTASYRIFMPAIFQQYVP